VNDRDCVEFLQWCLPRLGLRWPGFRKVRRQVCKRVSRRMSDLGLADTAGYRSYISAHDEEWTTLEGLCRITISRFYRDRGVFDALRSGVLPLLARSAADRGEDRVRCWSIGCASGEEPYTLQIVWNLDTITGVEAPPRLEVTATDADAGLLERAREGRFKRSSLKDLPADLAEAAFTVEVDEWVLGDAFKRDVAFFCHDIRGPAPEGPFDLVVCRNLVFTYFDAARQVAALDAVRSVLTPVGFLIIGIHETLPPNARDLQPYQSIPGVYRHTD